MSNNERCFLSITKWTKIYIDSCKCFVKNENDEQSSAKFQNMHDPTDYYYNTNKQTNTQAHKSKHQAFCIQQPW